MKPRIVRSPKAKADDLCTIAQAEVIANKVAVFYAEQVPGLIERVLLAKQEYDYERRWGWRDRLWRKVTGR